MAYAIETLNKGTGLDAHYQFLEKVRHLCGGFGDIGTITYSGTGNGTLTEIEAAPTSVTETWTLTCTAAATNGGTFSVTGSVSGAQASATVGTPYDNGLIAFTINDGTTNFVVNDQFTIPVTQGQLSSDGVAWTILRYDTSTSEHELIMKAPGISGTEEIYLGIRTYQDFNSDYYNLLLGMFTGYVDANSFDSQPGAKLLGCPAHNQAITYFMAANGQRLVFMLKVGAPIYTHGYLGKIFPYGKPTEFPYPVVCAAELDGAQAIRYSNPSLWFPYHSEPVDNNSYLYIRRPDGTWYRPSMWPFSHGITNTGVYVLAGSQTSGCQVPANNKYQLEALILHDQIFEIAPTGNIWGELDGVYFVSGFNNGVENVVQVGGSSTVDQTGMTVLQAVEAIKAVSGRAFVMGQNINLTSWRDFVAIEM